MSKRPAAKAATNPKPQIPNPKAAPEVERELEAIIIRSRNPGYEGVTFGVKFSDGEAVVHRRGRPNRFFGGDLAALADRFERFVDGYSVQRVYVGDPLPEARTAEPAGPAMEPPDGAELAARQAAARYLDQLVS